MKTVLSFLTKKSALFFLTLMPLMIFSASAAQTTDTKASTDAEILPWLGTWAAVDDKTSASSATVIEIAPGAEGRGMNITAKGTEQPVSESIIPDGISRPVESGACKGTSSYQREKQTGVILGKSEMICQGETYNVFTLKMLTSAEKMTDILYIKTPDRTSLAVRRFALERTFLLDRGVFSGQDSLILRTSAAAPWDLDKIINLSGNVETAVLEAALLEKNLQVKLDVKSLKKMQSAGTPDSIIDLLVAMSSPDKFRIEKNDRIAVEAAPPETVSRESYTYIMEPPYYGYGYPWRYYWNYYSPFWWGYPINMYPGYIVGGGGGGTNSGGDTSGASGYSEGRLSSGSGYVQITPRETGSRAVPRGSAETVRRGGGVSRSPASSYGGGANGASASPPGYSDSGSSGSSVSPSDYSGGGTGGASASPSGYSGGGASSGGTAVPR